MRPALVIPYTFLMKKPANIQYISIVNAEKHIDYGLQSGTQYRTWHLRSILTRVSKRNTYRYGNESIMDTIMIRCNGNESIVDTIAFPSIAYIYNIVRES